MKKMNLGNGMFVITISLLLGLSLLLTGCEQGGPTGVQGGKVTYVASKKNAKTANSGDESRSGKREIVLVERIIDGDTFVAVKKNEKVKIRLIGVNTPEIESNRFGNKKKAEFYSYEAASFLRNKIGGKKVIIESDKGDKDRYGRLLRYVYPADEGAGGECLNESILKGGYGKTMFYSPNTSRKAEYLKLEEKAKDEKIGVWSK